MKYIRCLKERPPGQMHSFNGDPDHDIGKRTFRFAPIQVEVSITGGNLSNKTTLRSLVVVVYSSVRFSLHLFFDRDVHLCVYDKNRK